MPPQSRAVLLALALFPAACATTSLQGTWRDPAHAGATVTFDTRVTATSSADLARVVIEALARDRMI